MSISVIAIKVNIMLQVNMVTKVSIFSMKHGPFKKLKVMCLEYAENILRLYTIQGGSGGKT